MDYTQSDAYVTHVGTGHRMHQDTAPITTEVSAADMNMVVWSLMEVLNAAGIAGATFDPATSATYGKLVQALGVLYTGTTGLRSTADVTKGAALAGFNATLNYAADTLGGVMLGTVDPHQYPWLAKGDLSADDTAAINACATWAATAGYGVELRPGRNYLTTDTVTFPAAIKRVAFNGGHIVYNGAKDRPAIVLGTANTVATRKEYTGISVSCQTLVNTTTGGTPALTSNWANVAHVGVRLIDTNRSRVHVAVAANFAEGIELYSDTAGNAYNNVQLGDILDNKYGVVLRTVGPLAGGNFVNEITFENGRVGNSSATNGFGAAYSFLCTWDKVSSYRSQNDIRVRNVCHELNGNGTEERIPYWFDGAGSFWDIQNIRYETGKGEMAIIDAGSAGSGAGCHIRINAQFVSGAGVIDDIREINGAVGNWYSSVSAPTAAPVGFNPPDVADCMKPNANTVSWLTDVWETLTSASPVPRKTTDANIELCDGLVRIVSGAIGYGVRTDVVKRLSVRVRAFGESNYGRLVVIPFDAAGNQLTGGTHVDSCQHNAAAQAVSYNAGLYGGAYVTGSDNQGRLALLRVGSTVARVWIGVQGGTANAYLRGIDVLPFEPGTKQGISPVAVSGRDVNGSATADPDTLASFSRLKRGEIVLNASAAATTTSYWQCTTAGYNAKTFVAGEAVVAGVHLRKNGANVYKAASTGTTGATAPTGVGTAISDGTVLWDFFAAVYVTTAGPANP